MILFEIVVIALTINLTHSESIFSALLLIFALQEKLNKDKHRTKLKRTVCTLSRSGKLTVKLLDHPLEIAYLP